MNLNAISAADFNALFRRLLAGYQHRIPDRWMDESVRTYYQVVRRFETRVVEQAVDALLNDGSVKYFPKAPQLAAICSRLASEERAAHERQHHVAADPLLCLDCGSAFEWRDYYTATFGRAAKDLIEFERHDGTVVLLLKITKLLCGCRWQQILGRLDDAERSAAEMGTSKAMAPA